MQAKESSLPPRRSSSPSIRVSKKTYSFPSSSRLFAAWMTKSAPVIASTLRSSNLECVARRSIAGTSTTVLSVWCAYPHSRLHVLGSHATASARCSSVGCSIGFLSSPGAFRTTSHSESSYELGTPSPPPPKGKPLALIKRRRVCNLERGAPAHRRLPSEHPGLGVFAAANPGSTSGTTSPSRLGGANRTASRESQRESDTGRCQGASGAWFMRSATATTARIRAFGRCLCRGIVGGE